MAIYIVNFISNMLLGLIFFSNGANIDSNALNKRKKIYLFITMLQFGLVCGFRSISVGWDTETYAYIFSKVPDTWDKIFENNMYIETGFSVFCSVIKILGGSYQTMFIISSLFVMGSCCIFIYRHSENVVLSVFIIISFPFYYSSFDIIRHFMVTAFFLLGYKYIEERKFWKYLLYIFLGSLFHSFAWVFLAFYFVRKIKWNAVVFISAIVATAFCYFYIEDIAIWLSELIGKSSGVESGWIGEYGGGIKTALMYGVVFIMAVVAYGNIENKTLDDMNAVNLILILFIFSILFINARQMTRLIMTSVPLMAIAIPKLINSKKIQDVRSYYILILGFVFIGIIYHIFMLSVSWQSVVPYVPYWKMQGDYYI